MAHRGSGRIVVAGVWGAVLALAAGCGGGSRKATVPIAYAIDQSRDLPHGLKTVAVLDAEMDSPEDQKWAELAANRVQARLVELNDRFGDRLTVVDRKHAKLLADERDLVASGVAEGPKAGSMVKQLGVDAFIVVRMSVGEQVNKGRARTITGVDVGALAETIAPQKQPPPPRGSRPGTPPRGRPPGTPVRPAPQRETREGHAAIQTEEVSTVSRTITVRPTFVLLDAATARAWDTFAPPPITRTEKASVSPIFGSGKTEADLTPRDRVIDEAVETYTDDFLKRFFPYDVAFNAEVRSSDSPLCREGVDLLKQGAHDQAIAVLQSAVEQDPQDDRAHFALGVALAAAGRYDDGLAAMERAIALNKDARYISVHARLTADRDHIYGPPVGASDPRAGEVSIRPSKEKKNKRKEARAD